MKSRAPQAKETLLKVCIYYTNANIFARFQNSGSIQLNPDHINCNPKLPLDSRSIEFTEKSHVCTEVIQNRYIGQVRS